MGVTFASGRQGMTSIVPETGARAFPARIELHIEELVLQGFAAADRYRIGDAVEQELLRLLSRQGWPASLRHSVEIKHMNAGTFSVEPGARAHTIGAQLAQSLHRRFNAGENTPSPKRRARANHARRIR